MRQQQTTDMQAPGHRPFVFPLCLRTSRTPGPTRFRGRNSGPYYGWQSDQRKRASADFMDPPKFRPGFGPGAGMLEAKYSTPDEVLAEARSLAALPESAVE